MSRRYQIAIAREFERPVTDLFAHLAEHENLAALFAPAKVRRLRDGNASRNGVGSQRRVQPWPLPAFVETVTVFCENELIEYRITHGGPLRKHSATMRFSSLQPGRSRVDVRISFEGRYPLVGAVIHAALRRGVARGLDALAK